MKIKCLVIDDEPLAIDLLKAYVQQTSYLELVGTFENPLKALDIIKSENIDLIYLDINMPQITGLDFAKILPENTRVIFTTAYDQYALDGFKLNALDYLLKPINYSEFLKASNKAEEWFKLLASSKSKTEEAFPNHIFVKSGYRMEKIELDDLLYVENQKDYVKFHIESIDEPISSLMSLQSLEDKLPNNKFMRVHRSFIVNLDKIKTIERNCIVFGKAFIPVSDSYKERFMEFINKSFFAN